MRPPGTILIGEEALRRRVREMAAEIAADTPPGRELSVLAVMDGAFVFCADLLRELPLPARVGFVRVVSVGRGGTPDRVALPEDLPVAGRDLLVVEDILDTGRTLEALVRRLERLGPLRLRVAVLLDKPARREVPVRVDFTGFEVEDRWVVGYGLDWNGLWRGLPHIAWVEPD